MSSSGKLYLVPVPITEEGGFEYLPAMNAELVRSLRYFIAEDAKTARRFLKGCSYASLPSAEIFILNEHTKSGELLELLQPAFKGENIGLMSDAGCPGIADPGAALVKIAHKRGVEVLPLVGPSSIVLSIMASGFNGQNFAFVGYLPIDKNQKLKRLKELEQLVQRFDQAQFFIETPYRNDTMFETLLDALSPQTLLFVGRHLNSHQQVVVSKTIAEWKKSEKPLLHKLPVVFGIYR